MFYLIVLIRHNNYSGFELITDWTLPWVKNIKFGVASAKWTRNWKASTLLVRLHIGRFGLWIDTRETSDEQAIKGAFPMAIGTKVFTLLETLVYPTTIPNWSRIG